MRTSATLAANFEHSPDPPHLVEVRLPRPDSQPQYRLRVNEVKVFYDVTESAVEVLAIIDKQEAQVWLDQEGTPGESGGAGQG